VEIGNLSKRQIGQLSGGQQQRMFIARALAQEAELMLMDEPLTGLDTPAQEGLLNLLDTLREQKVTVMVATHDLEQAAKHFDRLMLLNKKIVAFGGATEVLHADNLLYAYGGRFRSVEGQDGLLTVDDSCCDEGEHDHVH
jgi:ABC-type Mn2+/Zn2+ transport system ATPase subunit